MWGKKDSTISKSDAYADLLKVKDIDMKQTKVDDGAIRFAIDQNLGNGLPTIKVVIFFNPDQTMAHVYIFNYVSFEESKEIEILRLINELNSDYTFTTFYFSENSIDLKYSIDIEKAYNPETIFDLIISMIQTAREQYPKFMKVIWS